MPGRAKQSNAIVRVFKAATKNLGGQQVCSPVESEQDCKSGNTAIQCRAACLFHVCVSVRGVLLLERVSLEVMVRVTRT